MTVAERLAVELHRQYRAAEKALNGPRSGEALPLAHDHGWEHCNKKQYFRKRADLVIKRAAVRNPGTLGEAEQALDATVLYRRLAVEGWEVPKDNWFSHGGSVPLAKDYRFDYGFDTPLLRPVGSVTASPIDVKQLASLFQVPLRLLIGNTGDAREKAKRDAEVRKVLNAPSAGTFKQIGGGYFEKPRVAVTNYHFSKKDAE
jgi:hypothetical protein